MTHRGCLITKFAYKAKNKPKNQLISALSPICRLFLDLNVYIEHAWRPILEVIIMSEEDWEWEDDEEENEDEDW